MLTAVADDGVVAGEEMHTIGDADVVHSGRIAPLKTLSADNYPKIDAFFTNGSRGL